MTLVVFATHQECIDNMGAYQSNKASILREYTAYRDGSYALANWATIAQLASISTVQASWYAAMDAWCLAGPGGPGGGLAPSRALPQGAGSYQSPRADVERVPGR